MRPIVMFITSLLIIFSCGPAGAQSPFSGFNPATLSDRPASVFISGKAFAGSESMPLKAVFLDEWDGPFHPKDENHADLFWNADAGLTYGGYRAAVFYRGEAFLKANRDSLEFLRMTNQQNIAVLDRFDADIEINGFAAAGVELSKGFGLDRLLKGLDAGLTARYLNAHMVQDGSLGGTAVTTSAVTYDFDILLDYVYHDNLLYDRPGTVPGQGHGMSFDAGFRYEYSPGLVAELLFRDILGRIYWKDVPFTTARATSNVVEFDESGFQRYNPTISGFEAYKDYTQKLQVKTDLSVRYTKGPFMVRPEINFTGGHSIKWIFAGVKAWSALLVAGYNIDYQAVSLGVNHPNFSAQAFTDSVDLKNANALGFSLAAAYVF